MAFFAFVAFIIVSVACTVAARRSTSPAAAIAFLIAALGFASLGLYLFVDESWMYRDGFPLSPLETHTSTGLEALRRFAKESWPALLIFAAQVAFIGNVATRRRPAVPPRESRSRSRY